MNNDLNVILSAAKACPELGEGNPGFRKKSHEN